MKINYQGGKMNSKEMVRLVFCAVFIALVYVATAIISFTIPVSGGYIHFGDSIVLLSAMLLGPVYGAVAAGVGSALADFAGGFHTFIIPTLIIKGTMAFLIGLAYRKVNGEIKESKDATKRGVYHAVVAYVCIVGGYFLVDVIFATFLGVNTSDISTIAYASASIIPNSLQIGFGIITSHALYQLLKRPFEDIYRG